MAGNDYSFGSGWGYGALFAIPYSFCLGQLCAIPGAGISAIAAGILGCKEMYFMLRENSAPDAKKSYFREKKIINKNEAINCAAATAFFIVGALPIIGGPLGVYSAKYICKLREPIELI